MEHGRFTLTFAALITAIFVVETSTRGPGGVDRFVKALGFGGNRLLGQDWWRLVTWVLINPGFTTATGHVSPLAHLLGNLAILIGAGLVMERGMGPLPVIAAAVAGTVALDAWLLIGGWQGYSGGSSGAVFGVLGGAAASGVIAGGARRRVAIECLTAVSFFLFVRQGRSFVLFHLAAVGAGSVGSWLVLRARAVGQPARQEHSSVGC